jgi:acylphosphatase
MKAKSIKITGKVQGVNFRYYTKQEAISLGIQGTVMNLEDGSVLVRAEGEPEQLEVFINWCKTGPSRARVDGLNIEDIPVEGYTGFVILR